MTAIEATSSTFATCSQIVREHKQATLDAFAVIRAGVVFEAPHRATSCTYLAQIQWDEDGRPRHVRRYAFQCSHPDCELHAYPLRAEEFWPTEDAAEAAWHRAHCPELPVDASEFLR